MKSPLTGSDNVKLVGEINCSDLKSSYLDQYGIDVSDTFQNLEKIQVYKCLDSSYRFYFPFEIGGDSNFYEELMQFDWYYNPWKWEHTFCMNFIKKDFKILEIGCAKGDFLLRIKDKLGVDITGLELNKEAIEEGKKRGLTISGESIQQHAQLHRETYDFVCSFQVLEHISNVNSFIQSQINCLKKNGILVIAVPNNNSFIKFDSGGLLNFPPHHMGLWTPNSIKSLEELFNIKLREIYFEPLQPNHYTWFYHIQLRRLHTYNKFMGKIAERVTKPFYRSILKKTDRYIKGHTMLAVFQK